MTEEKNLLDALVDEVTAKTDTPSATSPAATDKKADEKEVKKTEKAEKTEKTAIGEEDSRAATPQEPVAASAGEKEDLMERLLEKSPQIPRVGDVLTGTIIALSSNTALVDLAGFGTGIVLGREIKDGMGEGKLKVGDKVSATVIDPETDDGYMELSIREASYDKAWDDLEEKYRRKEPIKTKIREANKGGLMVEINGIGGFLPVSQLCSEHYPRVEDGDKNKILELLKQLVGKELTVCIINADRENEKLIVSEKAAGSEKERDALARLKVGDEIEGVVSGVVKFGAFVKFSPPVKDREKVAQLEGLVHISELAWQLIDDPKDVVKTGDHVKAKVIGIDDTRISLSMKALQRDPWESVTDKYAVGDFVSGRVDKINHFGAFVYLDEDIHGLAHVSEFRDLYPGKKLEDMVEVDKSYTWKILSIEPKSHRMGLLLYTKEMLRKEKEKEEEKEDRSAETSGENSVTEKETKDGSDRDLKESAAKEDKEKTSEKETKAAASAEKLEGEEKTSVSEKSTSETDQKKSADKE